jgi:hypothetical protein
MEDISDKIDIFESIIKKEKECKKHYESLKMKYKHLIIIFIKNN